MGFVHTVMGSRTETRRRCWRKLSRRGRRGAEGAEGGGAAAVDGGKPWKGVVVNRGAAAPGHAAPRHRTPEGWCCAPARHKVALPGLMSLSGWPGAGAPRLTTTPLRGLIHCSHIRASCSVPLCEIIGPGWLLRGFVGSARGFSGYREWLVRRGWRIFEGWRE